MQVAENWSALRTPVHVAGALGAFQRRSPTGGAANGIPLYTRTAALVPATPETEPLSVFTGSLVAAETFAAGSSARAESNIAQRIAEFRGAGEEPKVRI